MPMAVKHSYLHARKNVSIPSKPIFENRRQSKFRNEFKAWTSKTILRTRGGAKTDCNPKCITLFSSQHPKPYKSTSKTLDYFRRSNEHIDPRRYTETVKTKNSRYLRIQQACCNRRALTAWREYACLSVAQQLFSSPARCAAYRIMTHVWRYPGPCLPGIEGDASLMP